MSTVEYVFAVIGILVIIGGFAYGIYDTYFHEKDTTSEEPGSRWH